MKKVISVILVCVLVLLAFSGCSGGLSSKDRDSVKEDLTYMNKKALGNIDSLLLKSSVNVEEWLKSTFSEEEVNYDAYIDEGVNRGYISKSGNVLILFTIEDGMSNMYIEPVLDGPNVQWCTKDDIKEINEMSKYEGASIDGAPKYGVLALYSYDENPQIRFWYNRGVENAAHLDYVYQYSDFILTDRE